MSTIRLHRKLTASTNPETALFFAVALLALLLSSAYPTLQQPTAAIVLVLAAALALIGLPHGGLDGWLAQRSGLARGAAGLLLFHVLYLLAAGAVVLLWLWQPLFSLIGFLLISAWHFAGDWSALPAAKRAMAGIALLGLPAWQWSGAVSTVFALLAGDGGFDLAATLAALGPLFALMLLLAVWQLRLQPWAALELAMLTGLALLTPPLLFFAVYFCTLHSPRQLRLSLARVAPAQRQRLLALAVGYAALAAVLVLAAGFAVTTAGVGVQAWLGQLDAEQGLRLVFIGLAALTVPHMGVAWLAAGRTGAGQ